MRVLLSFVMLLVPLSLAWAKDASTVSPRLIAAKTACIHMLHGTDKDTAAARKELKTWGRYKLVDECSKSDVTFLVIARYAPEVDTCGAIVQAQGTSDSAILWTGNEKCKTRTDLVVGRIIRELRAEVNKAAGPKTKPPAHLKKALAHPQHQP